MPASPPRLDDPARRPAAVPAPAPAHRRAAVRLLLGVLVPLGVLVLTGLVLLWPSGPATRVERAAAPGPLALWVTRQLWRAVGPE